MRLDEAARAYIGTPWQHHGRSKHGLDCIGLLVVAGRDIGIPVRDYLGYTSRPDPWLLLRHFLPQVRRVPLSSLSAGHMVTLDRQFMTHVGIVGNGVAPFSLIHVPTQGVCCEVSLPYEQIRGVYAIG